MKKSKPTTTGDIRERDKLGNHPWIFPPIKSKEKVKKIIEKMNIIKKLLLIPVFLFFIVVWTLLSILIWLFE